MNSYEQRQVDRRQRLEDAARKANAEAARRLDTAHEIGSHIPFGQPIMVGHHSEKRHRGDIERIDNNMRKGVEASKKADYYAEKAASVGKGGISSDDPEAIDKLREKLADLEQAQATMKAANKICKSKKLSDEDKIDMLVDDLGVEEIQAGRLITGADTYGRPGFPSYSLSNNNANIRSTKQRIVELEQRDEVRVVMEEKHDTPNPERQYGDITYRDNFEMNRVQLIFPGKPDDATRTILKANGFRWAHSEGAWQRQLTGNAQHAARIVLRKIEENIVGKA
jgi:hypothetical protein